MQILHDAIGMHILIVQILVFCDWFSMGAEKGSQITFTNITAG